MQKVTIGIKTLPQLYTLEKASLFFIGLASCFFIYLLLEGDWVLKLIPTDLKGATIIGTVTSLEGSAYRKLKNDSLHLPLYKTNRIYLEDLITTDNSSRLTITIAKDKNSIVLEPNTILRVSNLSSKLLLHLKSGAIVTNYTSDESVYIQMGVSIKNFQIRKGTYLIKNSNAGIQITAYAQNFNVKSSLEQESQQKTQIKNSNVESDIPEINNTKQIENEPSPDLLDSFKIPEKLPFPNNGQAFLVTESSNAKELLLVAKRKCQGSCQFNIKCQNQEIYSHIFKQNEIPFYKLNLTQAKNCHSFQWDFSDGNETFHNKFTIDIFSEEQFQKLIEQNSVIEVL